MMKMLFLFLCIFTLQAQESDSITYGTININGEIGQETLEKPLHGEEIIESTPQVSKIELSEPVQLIESPEQSPLIQKRLTSLDRKKLTRNRIMEYNNLLLQSEIEKQRFRTENKISNKIRNLSI